jgi:hypothetical protein
MCSAISPCLGRCVLPVYMMRCNAAVRRCVVCGMLLLGPAFAEPKPSKQAVV